MHKKSTRAQLIDTTRKGSVTLVVGAGISQPYGIPNWEELAKRVWKRAFPRQASPWKDSGKGPTQILPQFLPMVFELAYRKLGAKEFVTNLCQCMYSSASDLSKAGLETSRNSLAVLARLIVQESRLKEDRGITRVISLNADDRLERAIECLVAPFLSGKQKVIDAIRTPLDHPADGRGEQPIPVYHLHGYIPDHFHIHIVSLRDIFKVERFFPKQYLRMYAHMLVFTDAQYWSSASSILSFANRTMGAAMHDSHCIFIGLSMTDINLLRWLALRQVEFDKAEEQFLRAWAGNAESKSEIPFLDTTSVRKKLSRHFWIRPASDDPTGFLSKFLENRGVHSVEIASWEGPSFQKLIERCFPPPSAKGSG